MLSGSWLGGAVVMSGFGLRTWPMLIATGLGIPAAPPPRNLGVAAQHGGSCHHHTGIASTGVTPTNFVALHRCWFMRSHIAALGGAKLKYGRIRCRDGCGVNPSNPSSP
jgi:hypothetical protein